MSRGYTKRDYEWPEAEADLAQGVSPEVVAARLGEPIAYVLEIADQQGWPIAWRGPTAEQIEEADAIGRVLQ